MRGLKFGRLPGTLKEVSIISSLIGQEKALLYTDKQALDEILMKTGTPGILHLATHGFFLEDQDLSSLQDDDRGGLMSAMPVQKTPGVRVRHENPLLRSGIALAGANKALLKEGQSQGIVTADKILELKLRGTDMVVLSACETGLGDVQSGEGVYGLRRAFIQAGAKSLVMSLWSVPDTETKEFMMLFYQNVLSGKMSKIQAFRNAVLQQKEVVKQRYGEAHPFFWAAFVFLGEPGFISSQQS